MQTHPWLTPSASLVATVTRACAATAVRRLASVPARRLEAWASAWSTLLAALPALLQADTERVLAAIAPIDVLPVMAELPDRAIATERLERALVTLWLGLAGHPGLASPLALPGPFRTRVVDRHARLLAFGHVRGLGATARGPVVIADTGRRPIDAFVADELPMVDGVVLMTDHFDAPTKDTVERAQHALELVRSALPGGRLERVTIGTGAAVVGEARVGSDVDPAELVATAQAAFVRAAASTEPVMRTRGVVVENTRRVPPVDVLARAAGNAVALPWRRDGAAAAAAIVDDLDDLTAVAELAPAGADLVAAIRARTGDRAGRRRRALLVNPDADDFVYSYLFGRSVERRCRERGLHVDRIAINSGPQLHLGAELGQPVPPPTADGTELLVESEQDALIEPILRSLSSRRYDVVVANVRPKLFYDLFQGGFLAAPALLWDRHLHGGLREEGARRGIGVEALQGPRIHAWSLADRLGEGLHRDLARAGLEHGCGRAWPLDLEFFRSTATSAPRRLFAGGDNARDWPLLIDAVRDLEWDVHIVTAESLPPLPAQVRLDRRLTLAQFRDAMASAWIMALPLRPGVASGVTVLPMAMALGVPVVATRTLWTEQYIIDGEHGLLVPANDTEAFRAALVLLNEDVTLRGRLVAAARQRVAALCDLDAFTAAMFATL